MEIGTQLTFRVAKIRNSTKQMSMLRNGDEVLDLASEIEQHILQYYTDLYATDNQCRDNGLVERVIPCTVSAEDNTMLINMPTLEEVKSVVLSMNGAGAPGPDGFGGSFFSNFLGSGRK